MNERERLDSQLKWLERWVVFSGFVVAIGVFIEIGTKVLRARFDNEVIGGAIVILGVAAEVILTFIASRKTNRVQELADSEVAQAQRAASEANERAEVAQQAAAEANLERIRLEQQLSFPRRLSERCISELKELLEPHVGVRIDVFAFDSHILEVFGMAEQFNALFLVCGLDSRMWLSSGNRMAGVGVICATAATADLSMRFLAAAILGAVHKDGIECSGTDFDKTVRPASGELRGFRGRDWEPDNVADVRIQVGDRQLVSIRNLYPPTPPVTPPRA